MLPTHPMTAAQSATNEARALRLVLACLRAHEDEGAAQFTQAVWNEIDCSGCVMNIAEILASRLADLVIEADTEKRAPRVVEARIAYLLDFAAAGSDKPDD
jgi:hypothetical protein